MRGVVMHAPGDVRVEDREQPQIVEPTDAIIEVAAACICGSDLWPYRGLEPADSRPMGHEYVGTVTEVGSAVKNVKPGDFVVGSFCVSDDTCEICRSGYQSRCVNGGFMSDTQAQYTRVPQADGTLVAVPGGRPDDEATVASLLAASDVLGTGWFGAVAAEAGPGKTVAVVGDGAVGLMAVLAASQLGADRVIAMSRHEDRAALAREFGATDVVAERGEEGVAKIKEMTGGLGAHSVVEAVGTQESMMPGDRRLPARRARGLRRRLPRRGDPRPTAVLRRSAPARRPGPCPPVPPRPDRPDPQARDRSEQGLHHAPPAGGCGRRIQGHGPAPRCQGPAQAPGIGVCSAGSAARARGRPGEGSPDPAGPLASPQRVASSRGTSGSGWRVMRLRRSRRTISMDQSQIAWPKTSERCSSRGWSHGAGTVPMAGMATT